MSAQRLIFFRQQNSRSFSPGGVSFSPPFFTTRAFLTPNRPHRIGPFHGHTNVASRPRPPPAPRPCKTAPSTPPHPPKPAPPAPCALPRRSRRTRLASCNERTPPLPSPCGDKSCQSKESKRLHGLFFASWVSFSPRRVSFSPGRVSSSPTLTSYPILKLTLHRFQ